MKLPTWAPVTVWTLGVMAVETDQFGPSHMLYGIEAAARQSGHALSFVTLSRSGNDMASTLHRLRASHVQGVIIVAPVRRVIQAVTELDGDMPLVVVGGDPAIGAPTVTIDQLEGARLATQHLLDLGHRTVHHVAGPQTWVDATARMRGLQRAPGYPTSGHPATTSDRPRLPRRHRVPLRTPT